MTNSFSNSGLSKVIYLFFCRLQEITGKIEASIDTPLEKPHQGNFLNNLIIIISCPQYTTSRNFKTVVPLLWLPRNFCFFPISLQFASVVYSRIFFVLKYPNRKRRIYVSFLVYSLFPEIPESFSTNLVQTVWIALNDCWDDKIFLQPLFNRFWKLFLQVHIPDNCIFSCSVCSNHDHCPF